MRKLTIDERISVDGFIRRYGAANLDVQCRRNKTSWTVGFRVFDVDSARNHIESCFRIPLDELPSLPEIVSQIEQQLNSCIDDPDRAHGFIVPPGSAL